MSLPVEARDRLLKFCFREGEPEEVGLLCGEPLVEALLINKPFGEEPCRDLGEERASAKGS